MSKLRQDKDMALHFLKELPFADFALGMSKLRQDQEMAIHFLKELPFADFALGTSLNKMSKLRQDKEMALHFLRELPFADFALSARLAQSECPALKIKNYRRNAESIFYNEPDADIALSLYIRRDQIEDVFFFDDEGQRCIYKKGKILLI